jgi:hypothetical protein
VLPLVRTAFGHLLLLYSANERFSITYRGWAIYSTILGEGTPCYSSLLVPFSESIATLTSSHVGTASTSTVAIVTQIFTRKFTLQQAAPSGIGEKTKLGIGIGVGLGVIAILVLAFLFWKWKSRNQSPYRPPSPPKYPAVAHTDEYELHGQARSELPVLPEPDRPVELQGAV